MRRRDFIRLASGAAAWPLAAQAQPGMSVVGFLGTRSPEDARDLVAGFRQGLREAGLIEGRTVAIEFLWAEGRYDRLPILATEFVRRKVTVLVAQGAPAAVAARAATSSVPIIFYMGEDPVELGLVASLNRPGGNITGVADFSSAVVGKRLELLCELLPRAEIVAALVNPKHPSADTSTRDAQEGAAALGRRLHIVTASTPDELETAFALLPPLRAGALLTTPDGFFNGRADLLAALARRYAMPASSERRNFPAAGGLMSYGGSNFDGLRRCAAIVAAGSFDNRAVAPR